MIEAILAFLKALPRLLQIFERFSREQKIKAQDDKIQEDNKAIEKAFETKDAEALNRTFDS